MKTGADEFLIGGGAVIYSDAGTKRNFRRKVKLFNNTLEAFV